MVRTGAHLWKKHPAADNDLTSGEKAADQLKRGFGTWTALGSVAAVIAIWIIAQQTGLAWDAYPFILLNLCLSCLAAVQGIILQISANRGDKTAAEVALHTSANTDHLISVDDELLGLQRQQWEVLCKLDAADQREDVHQALLEAILAKTDPAALERITSRPGAGGQPR